MFEDINVITAFGYRWGQLMAYAMYDTLVKYDSKGKAIPMLATKWETPTRKTTIVTIRQGVKFHSGKDLTVEDVVWSLNRIHDTKPVSNNFLALPRTSGAPRRSTTRAQDHHQEADADGRELALLVHHAGELRQHRARRQPKGTGPFKY